MTGSAKEASESELHGLDTPAIVSEKEWDVAWESNDGEGESA